MRLLIVDDDPEFRSMIHDTAPSWLDISECASSREAMDTLESQGDSVDLAIVDMNMDRFLGELDEEEGLGLVRWMEEERKAVPTILVSALLQPDSETLNERQSVVGFLQKPLDLERLYDFLNSYLRLFEATRE